MHDNIRNSQAYSDIDLQQDVLDQLYKFNGTTKSSKKKKKEISVSRRPALAPTTRFKTHRSLFFFLLLRLIYIHSREFVPVAIQHSIRRQLLCGYYDFRIYANTSCVLFSFCCVLAISFKAQFVLTVWAWSDSDTTVFLTYKSRCLVCSSLTKKMSLSSPSNVRSAGGDERKEGQAMRDSCSEAFRVRKLSHDVENKALASLFFLEQAQRKANLSQFPTKPAIQTQASSWLRGHQNISQTPSPYEQFLHFCERIAHTDGITKYII